MSSEKSIIDYLYINNIDIINISQLSRDLGIPINELTTIVRRLLRMGYIDRVDRDTYIVRFDRILDSVDNNPHSRICKDVMRYLYENSVSVVVRSDMCRIKLKRGRCITLKELVNGLGKSVIEIARALNALSRNGFIDRRHRDVYRIDWDRVLSYRKCFLDRSRAIVYEDPIRLVKLSSSELEILSRIVESGVIDISTTDLDLIGFDGSKILNKWYRYGIARRLGKGEYQIDIDIARRVVGTCRDIVLRSRSISI